MKAVTYDSKVIDRYATSLYRQALTLIIVGAAVGAFLGWALGWTLVRFQIAYIVNSASSPLVLAVAGAALGGWNGYAKGMRLRVEAQLALCQARIEENTRLLSARHAAVATTTLPQSRVAASTSVT